MFKKSSSRNQRSKSVKIKHGLQILLLLGICFWLIYQVKYSHDKKRELNEKDAKTSVKDESGGAGKLGRKDLHPRRDETTIITNNVEDEEESREEIDDSKRDEELDEETSKHEVEQEEEAGKHEHDEREDANESVIEQEVDQEAAGTHEEEDEHEEEENRVDDPEVVREGGEDETDEPDEDKVQGEVDREEEFIDEEKEREEDNDEKETEGDDEQDKKGQAEDDNVLEDEEHDGSESSHSRHEAREEHYKADDASSAVTHDAQTTDAQTTLIDLEKRGSRDGDDNTGSSTTGQESNSTISNQVFEGQYNSRSNMEENRIAETAANSSEVVSEIKDHDDTKTGPANISLPKLAVTTKAKGQEDAGVNSSEVNMGSSNNLTMTGPPINGTKNILDSPQAQNQSWVDVRASDGSDQENIRVEMAKASTGNASDSESNSTSSVSTAQGGNLSNFNSDQTSAVKDENINPDMKGEAENILKLPLMTKESDDHTDNETLDHRSETGSSNTS